MKWTFKCSPDQADQLAETLCAFEYFHFARTTFPVSAIHVSEELQDVEYIELYTGTEAPVLPLAIQNAVLDLGLHFASVELDEKKGQMNWKQYFTPQHIQGVCDILPPWEWSPLARFSKPESSDVIVIQPELAFGTGSHPTTQLGLCALQWVSKQSPEKKWTRLLDAGTGSGIYAIYARKLGIPFILACDVDEVVFKNLDYNFKINHAQLPNIANVNIKNCHGTFDWTWVNISFEILMTHTSHICSWVNANGYLFLTGFLFENKTEIEQTFQKTSQNLSCVWRNNLHGWSGFVFKNNESGKSLTE
jgi:ribosomal protein L11 methyltransferase